MVKPSKKSEAFWDAKNPGDFSAFHEVGAGCIEMLRNFQFLACRKSEGFSSTCWRFL
ncbi:MAG: hypothetical protein KKE23_03200 [Nanoarchaeota archaeon]|nr:hypothetical protein [Nanoarchaeota archaeon]